MDRQMINYLPEFLRDIREYRKIMEIEQPEFEESWEQADYALQEAILMTATDYGLSRWEGMMGVTPKGTETIEERRFRILSLLQSDTPYTYRQLEKLLANLCGEHGYEIQMDYSNYNIKVSIILPSQNSYEAVKELLDKIIPANLTKSIEFLVRPSGAATVHTGAAVSGIYMSITAEVKNYGVG